MTFDRNETFVDLETVTRKTYYDERKTATVSGKDCFIKRTESWDILYVKDGENFYAGIMLQRVDADKFEGINVTRTRDIYRIYIEQPALEPLAVEEPPLGEAVGTPEPVTC